MAAGAIGGGPTLIGTAIGYRISSQWLQLVFLASGFPLCTVIMNILHQTLERLERSVVRERVLRATVGEDFFAQGIGIDILRAHQGVDRRLPVGIEDGTGALRGSDELASGMASHGESGWYQASRRPVPKQPFF